MSRLSLYTMVAFLARAAYASSDVDSLRVGRSAPEKGDRTFVRRVKMVERTVAEADMALGGVRKKPKQYMISMQAAASVNNDVPVWQQSSTRYAMSIQASGFTRASALNPPAQAAKRTVLVKAGNVSSSCSMSHAFAKYISDRSYYGKPSDGDRQKERVAVVIRGRSFRTGEHGQKEGTMGTSERKETQLAATNSQVARLMVPFEEKGYIVDVFSETYTTQFTDELVGQLSPFLRMDRRSSENSGGQGTNIRDAAAVVHCYAETVGRNYTLVVFIRHDILFKREVASLILDKRDKFTAPFHLIKDLQGGLSGHVIPRAPDTMQSMPWTFFEPFIKMTDGNSWPREDIFGYIAGRLPGGSSNYTSNLAYLMPDVYADCDPAKIANPLYRLCQRGEGVTCNQSVEKSQDGVDTFLRSPCLRDAEIAIALRKGRTTGDFEDENDHHHDYY